MYKGTITVDGKLLINGEQIRDFFLDELSQGHEVIPCGDPCEGFDYKKGCQGHEQEEELGNNGEPIKNPNPEVDEDQVEQERLKVL